MQQRWRSVIGKPIPKTLHISLSEMAEEIEKNLRSKNLGGIKGVMGVAAG